MNGDLISRSVAKEEILSWAVIINKPHLLSKDDTLHVLDTLPAVDAVVLPCKVGDTVWGIRNYKGVNCPQQGKVDQMYYTNDMRLHIKIKHICIGEWGKKIFPTREEAEAALKRRADDADW